MSPKGQSATEYLMTYGWAILAITIVAGLLYLNVFSDRACSNAGPQGYPQVQGVIPQQNEFSINSSGALIISLENRVGEDVTLLKVLGPLGTIDIPDVPISEGGSAVVTVPGFAVYKQGACYSHVATFIYSAVGSSIEQRSSGTLNGRF